MIQNVTEAVVNLGDDFFIYVLRKFFVDIIKMDNLLISFYCIEGFFEFSVERTIVTII
ncbi:hypothetical protein ES705_36439 [subsurface metagenome]